MFHVVGANPMPQSVRSLNGTQMDGVVRIVVHGFLSSSELKALYGSVRVSVAPLRWGAGVKGKVNSAMETNRDQA